MTGRLAGQVALVAGGSSGIGAATAELLASAGADVALVGRRADRLAEVAGRIHEAGGRAYPITTDLAEAGAVPAVVAATRDRLGPVDILVCSAAMVRLAPIHEIETRHWELMLRLNLGVPFQLAREVLPAMRARGRGWLINISSAVGLEPVPGSGGYGVSKAALNHLTELLAEENRDFGVRAAALCPGWVMTRLSPDPGGHGVAVDDLLTPDDVAETVLWLVTRPARMNVGPLIPLAPTVTSADTRHTVTVQARRTVDRADL